VWNSRAAPFQLTPDRETQFVNQNAYRVPASPFAPLFAAADALGYGDSGWADVDVVSDRNSLRKLVRWAGGNAARDFRIDLELAGASTMFLVRWEKRDREAPSGYSYGHRFEEETTNAAAGCADTVGHHRIVKYDYFGLKMVVRFEVDACLQTAKAKRSTEAGLDDLLGAMSVRAPSAEAAPGTTVRVVKAGTAVPQSALLELTTRSANYIAQFDWDEALPQLYLSGTPHLRIGVHERGRFVEVRAHSLGEGLLVARRRAAAATYERLGRVLEALQGLVVEHGAAGRLSVVCVGGVLRVYSRAGAASLVPDDIRRRFAAA